MHNAAKNPSEAIEWSGVKLNLAHAKESMLNQQGLDSDTFQMVNTRTVPLFFYNMYSSHSHVRDSLSRTSSTTH